MDSRVVAPILDALRLPAATRVDQRIPKSLLLDNGARTAADRRAINEAVAELRWLAVLKPSTVGLAAYEDDERATPEIAVVGLELHEAQRRSQPRLVELIHRAIPYPVALLTTMLEVAELSLATKRWSLAEVGRVTLDGDPLVAPLDSTAEHFDDFSEALALTRQPYRHLHALYLGWLDAVITLQASRRSGHFTLSANRDHSRSRHNALLECRRIENEMVNVEAEARREKHVARRAALNAQMQQLRRQLAEAEGTL